MVVSFLADGSEAEVPVEADRPGVAGTDPEVDAVDTSPDESVEQRRHQPSADPPALASLQDVDVHVGRELLDNARRCDRWVVDSPDQLVVRCQGSVCGRFGVAGAQRRPPPQLAVGVERPRVLGTEGVADGTDVVLGNEGQVGLQGEVRPDPVVAEQLGVAVQRTSVGAGVASP